MPPSTNPDPNPDPDPPSLTRTIQSLNLRPHLEGGYFTQTDLHPLELTLPTSPNPNPNQSNQGAGAGETGPTTKKRPASTTITYLLTPSSPIGRFHRNQGRTIHSLIRGRGMYVVIRPDLGSGVSMVERFVVGGDWERGERVQWVVEGGFYKGCFLLEGEGEEGMLISETVVPGFDWADHDFLSLDQMKTLLTEDEVNKLKWLLR